MMIGNVSDAYNDYKIYPYALGNDRAEKDSAVSSSEECQTCKNRKYQDGSDEMVSFKSAAHVSPQAAAGRVRAHEGEHFPQIKNHLEMIVAEPSLCWSMVSVLDNDIPKFHHRQQQ